MSRTKQTANQNEALRVRLKDYMKSNKLTLKAVAEMIGKSVPLVQSFCCGRFGVSAETAADIESIIGKASVQVAQTKKMVKTRAKRKTKQTQVINNVPTDLEQIRAGLTGIAEKIAEMQLMLNKLNSTPQGQEKQVETVVVATVTKNQKPKLDYEPLPKNKVRELTQQNRARARLGVKLITTKIVQCLSCNHKFETQGNRLCSVCRKETDFSVQKQEHLHY